ncbi:TfuA-like protein [Rhizobium sp. 007]|uniref:TfuA-like protein n=1 Tax=Rhizobium sp. 007 TaxID=2785056 RepID=UPI00188EB6DE|nr:TfuA-like protein [Rhizobium sp. 007]QPB23020.1 TfuA-like protein [Rhizobium sp. 007]
MAATNGEGPILVFLGPTMLLGAAEKMLDAIFLQPASQGDILLAAHAFHPRAMVLIDGQFEDRPAVRHKEILWAMSQGILMIGAASMGALRAAELCEFGMIGLGLIYRWYRRWPLAPDDAVAVQSGPAELGFLPLTDSMIDLQRTFSALMRRKIITPAERSLLTSVARAMNFRDRSLGAVLRAVGWPDHRISELGKDMVTRQKKVDALLALRMASRLSAQHGTRPAVAHPWIVTNTFIRDLEAAHIDISLLSTY